MSQAASFSNAGGMSVAAALVSLVVALTAETYTNGSNLTLDASAVFPAKIGQQPIEWQDVYEVLAVSDKGHSVSVAKNAAFGKFDVRLFNGTTELTTGAVTASIKIVAFLANA